MKWPKKEAKFDTVISGMPTVIKVKANTNIVESFYEYSKNYKYAAHLVTEYILGKGSISHLDTYFFALAFLYRHSLELILKAIGFKYIEDKAIFIKDTFHNLSEIFKQIEVHMLSITCRDAEMLGWIKTYLADISQIDKESDSFRYPFKIIITKDAFLGDKQYDLKRVFEKQTHIDLLKFANKLEVAYAILDSYYCNVDFEEKEYKEYSPSFIEEGGYYYAQCVVGYGYSINDFYPYTKAYIETGSYIKDFIQANPIDKDKLFLPMCYLFRNGIELGLKEVWFEDCAGDFQTKCQKLIKRKHKILSLWNLITQDIIENADASDDDETMGIVSNYINQLHQFDLTADIFRYPTDKDLRFHFIHAKDLDYIVVGDFFEELAAFLSAVDTMISVNNDWKADMEAEYSSYIGDYY